MPDRQPDFVYPQVRDLAATFLERNRVPQARIVDSMLASRDQQIAQLKQDVSDRDAAVERYQYENAEVRGYVGRVRSILAEAVAKSQGEQHTIIAVELFDAVDRVLKLPIPGVGAKPQRALYHPFKGRVQLCHGCDRPNLCVAMKAGSAPCGENRIVDVEVTAATGGKR